MSSARAGGLLATACIGRAPVRALGTLACALVIGLAFPNAVVLAHEGNPNFRSDIRALEPAIPGVQIEVLNYDDRLLLINSSGKEVDVKGYDGEPYVRILADGTVQQNGRSPTFYLNEDRFGNVSVPPQADPKAPPQWQTEDKTGRFEWHDHRIHWMSKSPPPKVKDKDVKTRIFDWRVPLEVGGKPATLTGVLYWQPENSSAPVGAFIALGAFCLFSLALVLLIRARRRRPVVRPKAEAW